MPEVRLIINGEKRSLIVDNNETLLDTLRERLHLIGSKCGCDAGDCGACTILLDGQPVNSCLTLTVEATDTEITTIEGIDSPIQERFVAHGSFQCGYCAPGAVVSSAALLEKSAHPTDEEIETTLSGHICRCTGYVRIIKALRDEAEDTTTDPRFDVVGKPKPRKDIWDKITGKARYTADFHLPGMVHGALVTSPHPHARVISVDTSEALATEDVLLALTSADTPSILYGVTPARYDETIFPRDTVRHVGDPVAAVFATSRRKAEMAASKVKVTYEVLETISDPVRARESDAPQLHEQFPGNVNTEIHQNFGDIEKAFAEAHYVREDVFQGQKVHQAFLEPQAALAVEEGDLINVWTANQNPHLVQVQLARVLDIPESTLRVIRPAMGGGFGGKAETTKLEFLSVIATRKLKRPVMMVMDRKQVFLHGRGRHAQTVRLKSAFSKEGKMLGTHEEVTLDGGAYTSYGIITSYYSGNLLPILYKLPAFKFDAYRVCTNLPSCGAMRGNGTPQPRFALESHLDMAAADLGISPLEIRRQNLVESDYTTINDLRVTSCGLADCLEKAAEMSGYNDKHRKLPFGHGVGVGLGSFVSGAGYPIIRGDFPHSACSIRIGEDGKRAFLHTGASEIGQGSDTVLCQIAAEALGIAYDDMTIFSSDSAITPTDLGSYSSRVTFMAGNAVIDAAKGIKKQLTEFWKETVADNSNEVTFKSGQVSDGETTLLFSELSHKFFRRKGPLQAAGIYNPPKLGGKFKGAAVGTSPAYSFCAMVAEVDVDPDTGVVRVKKVWAAHDSGTVINPVTFHGQVEGSISMGVGETLMESVEQKDGHLRNPNFHDYLLPTVADMPEIFSTTVPVRDPNGPFGAKEVGEGSILPVMGAIANAIEDAVGARVMSLPITAEKVLAAMKRP